MSSPWLELAARTVLGRFGLDTPGTVLTSLGNAGGFSGARLWRVGSAGGHCCLRAWPPGAATSDRLEVIHRLMHQGRASGLSFIPRPHLTPDGRTWVEHAGRLWELTTWLPGRADFHQRPTGPRLQAACRALARLHLAWCGEGGHGNCPAVRRRLESFAAWTAVVRAGWRPEFTATGLDPVGGWAERAWKLVNRHDRRVMDRLTPWTGRCFPLQPCLCDVWHDHVLFEGDRVTGLVDYGGVKTDHVAVDLARLLGSLVGDDPAMREAGLGAYAAVRPLTEEEYALVSVLDETGTLLGAANWLRWLFHESREYPDPAAVARRLAALVQRLENW
jgi:homoserine kinase type II